MSPSVGAKVVLGAFCMSVHSSMYAGGGRIGVGDGIPVCCSLAL